MDFVTDLPVIASGHDAICVFVDKLTKMVRIAPTTSDVTAIVTADLFVSNVIRHHGLPTAIISDRGTQFTSEFFKQVCKKLDIRQWLSTAFHPQSDGQTEIMNRTIEDCLRRYVGNSHHNWDELLPMVEFAINNSKNESTAETPFFLNYGVHPKTPEALQLPERFRVSNTTHSTSNVLPSTSSMPAVIGFTDRMQSALVEAKKHLQSAQSRQKAYADSWRTDVSYAVGDQVLLQSKNIKLKHPGSKKLLPKWLGPFRVSQVVNPVAYKLQLPQSMSKVHPVFHVSLLAPYQLDGRVQPPPPLVEVEATLEYEVERILDKRTRKRGRSSSDEYLVKWQGYGHENNTWEPLANLTNCVALVREFESSLTQSGCPRQLGTRRRRRRAP